MTYTIKMDFYLDGEVIPDEELKECLSELLDGSAYDVSNIEILEVND